MYGMSFRLMAELVNLDLRIMSNQLPVMFVEQY